MVRIHFGEGRSQDFISEPIATSLSRLDCFHSNGEVAST
jgi:hypothetical protein